MDEMKIKSTFILNIIEHFLCKYIKKKFGIDPTIDFEDIVMYRENGYLRGCANVSFAISDEDLTKVIFGSPKALKED